MRVKRHRGCGGEYVLQPRITKLVWVLQYEHLKCEKCGFTAEPDSQSAYITEWEYTPPKAQSHYTVPGWGTSGGRRVRIHETMTRYARKLKPHPLSKNSRKKALRDKKLIEALQIVHAGPENNACFSRRGVTVNSTYYNAMKLLQAHNDRLREYEQWKE